MRPLGPLSHKWRLNLLVGLSLLGLPGSAWSLSASGTRDLAAESRRFRSLPPAWQVPDDEEPPPEQKSVKPWWHPEVGFGVGLASPEIVPLEGLVFFGRYVAIRGYYTPPLPFNVRIDMPQEVITVKNPLAIVNPDYTIRLKARYGAHFGLDVLSFPFGGSFFVAGGVEHRRVELAGSAQSPLLLCGSDKIYENPPCSGPNDALETHTQLALNAEAVSTALLWRASLGWLWRFDSSAYMMLTVLGVAKPTGVAHTVGVSANLASPSSEVDSQVSANIASIKQKSEADMTSKAVQYISPAEQKLLPVVGLSVGFTL